MTGRARLALGGAVVCVAVWAPAACIPIPDNQTTSVDVTRYQDLAADPWLAATDLTVGRYAFGTNGQFSAGSGQSARTMTGTIAEVLAVETAAAAREGWIVAAARCGEAEGGVGADDERRKMWPATVELVRELSDGSVAVAAVGVGESSSALDDHANRELPRRVGLAAFAPHHTNETSVDVPDEPVDYQALVCLGGPGGMSVGPTDLMSTVHDDAASQDTRGDRGGRSAARRSGDR